MNFQISLSTIADAWLIVILYTHSLRCRERFRRRTECRSRSAVPTLPFPLCRSCRSFRTPGSGQARLPPAPAAPFSFRSLGPWSADGENAGGGRALPPGIEDPGRTPPVAKNERASVSSTGFGTLVPLCFLILFINYPRYVRTAAY